MDIHNQTKVSRAISPAAAVADNTALVSQILDTAGFAAHELAILTGDLADVDATFAVLLEEGDAANLSDAAAVADADMIGTEAGAGFTFAADNATRKLGYKGSKRYIRATVTPANNTGAAYIAAVWVQSGARKQPVS